VNLTICDICQEDSRSPNADVRRVSVEIAINQRVGSPTTLKGRRELDMCGACRRRILGEVWEKGRVAVKSVANDGLLRELAKQMEKPRNLPPVCTRPHYDDPRPLTATGARIADEYQRHMSRT
jgi:hypothetical protein